MTLKQLEYVIKVAETGNITKAAESLFIAQPSLTHAISELEKEMNVQIFARTNKGISVTKEGEMFLAYARQVLEQANLLEDKYKKNTLRKTKFSVSCQHYSFCVTAFSELVKKYETPSYNFTLRETQTHEIIEDVAEMKSEIGILYLSKSNREVIEKIIKKNDLVFESLFKAAPHVFIGRKHPLAKKKAITIEDLKPYPYLTFEQGEYNSFYFSEEFISTIDVDKNIMVRDRASLFNLVVNLNGYTVSSGVISKDVNEGDIISRPLIYDEEMNIGYVKHKNIPLSDYAKAYIESIKMLTK
ncbi:MAG: LysR family transcriptional regulator [Acholeplasmatales bacterium]|nr:LysR family transcriptional regulator [Acholeplasmatales bacterium]